MLLRSPGGNNDKIISWVDSTIQPWGLGSRRIVYGASSATKHTVRGMLCATRSSPCYQRRRPKTRTWKEFVTNPNQPAATD